MAEDEARNAALRAAQAQMRAQLYEIVPPLAESLGVEWSAPVLQRAIERVVQEELVIATQILPAVAANAPSKEIMLRISGTDGQATVRSPKQQPKTAEEALAHAAILAILSSPAIRILLDLQGFKYQFMEPKEPPKPKITLVG